MADSAPRFTSVAWATTWKTPAVILLTVVGAFAANTAGWNGAAFFADNEGSTGELIDHLLGIAGAIISISVIFGTYRIAKHALWVMVPIMAYSAIVLGAWDGFASGFDSFRLAAIQHRSANAYTLRHMTPDGFDLSCDDPRIVLTIDAKALCATRPNSARH
jgi:uncharacterized membrane protein YeaQ/YmgE (transglycosylase-associated protein family)